MISVEQYRASIGSFSSIKYTFRDNRGSSFNKNNIKLGIILALLVLIGVQGEGGFDRVVQKSRNKSMHSKVGNNKFNLKMLHWNKANTTFRNKMDDIYEILDLFKPDIFSICESNYKFKEPHKIRGYKIENSRLHIMSSFARNSLLIRDSLEFNRRHDLEDSMISSIWVEIILSNKKRVLVCSFYRQWKIPQELGVENSDRPNKQLDRFLTFAKQVDKATLENKDIIIMTDDNINTNDDYSSTTNNKNRPLKDL